MFKARVEQKDNFTFYCSSIKGFMSSDSAFSILYALHSTVVLLKAVSVVDSGNNLVIFTFYCSSIKG